MRGEHQITPTLPGAASIRSTFAQLYRRFTIGPEYQLALTKGHLTPIPYNAKRRVILFYQMLYSIPNFVETGTYEGDTLDAVADAFVRCASIELDAALFASASARFASRPDVSVYHGDSSSVLPVALEPLDGPCVFWLDGHYSYGKTARGETETPIQAELAHIFARNNQRDVILIDDARLFCGRGGYPSLRHIVQTLRAGRPNAVVDLQHDIIRSFPRLSHD